MLALRSILHIAAVALELDLPDLNTVALLGLLRLLAAHVIVDELLDEVDHVLVLAGLVARLQLVLPHTDLECARLDVILGASGARAGSRLEHLAPRRVVRQRHMHIVAELLLVVEQLIADSHHLRRLVLHNSVFELVLHAVLVDLLGEVKGLLLFETHRLRHFVHLFRYLLAR